MPTYKFMVSGIVDVEAPNIAQAWAYIRREGRLREVARISAGSGCHCQHMPSGRNTHWEQYRLSANSVRGSKLIEYVRSAAKEG